MGFTGRFSHMTQPRASRRFDWGFFILVIVASQGFSAFIPGNPGRTSLVLSAAVMAILVIREPSRALAVVFSDPLFFFIAWLLGATLMARHAVDALFLTALLVLMIVYCSMRQSSAKHTIEVFALATSVALVPSIAGLLVGPLGVPLLLHAGSIGGYAGYFPWNSSAGLCAAVALLSVAWVCVNTGFKWWQVPAAAGALWILVVAQSASSKFALAAAAGMLLVQATVRRVGAKLRPTVICGFGIAGILLAPTVVTFLSDFSAVGDVAGRTSSLSARTTVWSYALDGISASPYWGYGARFWDRFGGWPSSAHNGFLDIALSAGIPAAVMLLAILAIAAVRLTLASSPLLPFLTFGVVANLVVSQLAVPTVASLALWVAVGATVRLREAKASTDVGVSAAGGPQRSVVV